MPKLSNCIRMRLSGSILSSGIEKELVVVFISTIKECGYCGLKDDDLKEGHLRGFGGFCVWCGAMDNCWNVQCTCGNDELWSDDYEVLAAECPKCGVHSHNFEVTAVDSALIIDKVLKRPELHRQRAFVPISFVDTLMDYLAREAIDKYVPGTAKELFEKNDE